MMKRTSIQSISEVILILGELWESIEYVKTILKKGTGNLYVRNINLGLSKLLP